MLRALKKKSRQFQEQMSNVGEKKWKILKKSQK